MIQHPSDQELLKLLDEDVASWFLSRFKSFTPPQRGALPAIAHRRNVLVCGPVGTGKTLSAFLYIISYLISLAKRNQLEDRVYCIYISPLRALVNDIQRNLLEPLDSIRNSILSRGENLQPIRALVRSSDVTQSQRQRMLKNPPHILITTPETLAIVLNSPRFRKLLTKLEFVIVDELHELADSKRGAHLSISLERLQNLSQTRFVRIGLGATLEPLDLMAQFLVGFQDGKPRACQIIDARFAKPLQLKVICPSQDLIQTPSQQLSESLYRELFQESMGARSILIFTNTRSGAERVAYHLSKLIKDQKVATHHSSLSRELRLEVERSLKQGELRWVTTSTSLELGIDIGCIDLCIQIGSPKSVTRLIQRVGRSGHLIDRISRGILIGLDRDDLEEDLVLAKCALERKLDRIQIVGPALDVLAQHLIGMSLESRWDLRKAYELIRCAFPYRHLSWEKFIRVLRYLAGEHFSGELRIYPKLWLDESQGVFGRKRGMRGIYMTHIGTIPEEHSIPVYADGKWIGKLDESFLERLVPGDIFVLGGKTYRFIYSDGERVYARDAKGANPTIPSWIGEMLPLSFDSALEIGKFRMEFESRLGSWDRDCIIQWLMEEYHASPSAAQEIYRYYSEQYAYSEIPNHLKILVELWFDGTYYNVIFHAIYGRRVNDALSRGYGYKLMKLYGANVGIATWDHGFLLKLRPKPRLEDIPRLLQPEELESILKLALGSTELVKRRFRHCSNRFLSILKEYRGHRIRLSRQQRASDLLLRYSHSIPGSPILEETYREILYELMDLENAKWVLEGIRSGEIKMVFREVDVPSPFGHGLIALSCSDVVLMESRRELLLELHRRVLERISHIQKSISVNHGG